jgi:RNA polymerase sigma-32 factor
MLESAERDRLATDGIASALKGLDERSRRIVEERWLKVNDDGSGGMTLHELAAETASAPSASARSRWRP